MTTALVTGFSLGLATTDPITGVIEWSVTAVKNQLENVTTGTLTASQLADIQAQAAADITVAAGGDSALAARAIAQMQQETAAAAATPGPGTTPWYVWAGLAGVLALGIFAVK